MAEAAPLVSNHLGWIFVLPAGSDTIVVLTDASEVPVFDDADAALRIGLAERLEGTRPCGCRCAGVPSIRQSGLTCEPRNPIITVTGPSIPGTAFLHYRNTAFPPNTAILAYCNSAILRYRCTALPAYSTYGFSALRHTGVTAIQQYRNARSVDWNIPHSFHAAAHRGRSESRNSKGIRR